MIKQMIRPIVLALVFLLTVVGLSFFTGINQVKLTEEMPEATLPVIHLWKDEIVINEMFGYRGEMNVIHMRDTVTPLSDDLVLPVTIQTFQNQIEGISYEVRSMDMERLLEKNQIEGYSEKAGEISTEFKLQNLLEEDREYRLIITLTCAEEEINYYTRIILAKNSYVDESLQFVLDFHNKTFDPDQIADLAIYLEPNQEGDNTTLHKVTIHSNLKQVGWADFDGEVLKDPILSVKEINSTYNSFTLNYVVVANGENGETEFYNVEEYFRVRYSTVSNRMHLLDYERTMNEIFKGNGDIVFGASLLLGIRDEDVIYKANEKATIIGFVQERDLWSYNSATNQLSLVFSFRGMEGINDRDNNPNHDIRIIKIEEDGSMDFVVYGYMNRGEHEGYTGVNLYHYDGAANTVQEKLFVQSKDSYQVLKESWGELFYISTDGCFYMIADGGFYGIRPEDKSMELIRDGLEEGNYAVSADGRYIAWREIEADNRILITDLENGRQWQVTGDAKDVLRPVGFIEEDFIYGVLRKDDTEGLMEKIIIIDQNLQLIKEYKKAGYYISDAYVDDTTVVLKRVWETESGYTKADDDAIKSHEIEVARSIKVETQSSTIKQTQVKLTAKKTLPDQTPYVLTPKAVVVDADNSIALNTTAKDGYFYVYLGGKIILRTPDVAEAVQYADNLAAVVIKDNLWDIWRRGTKTRVSLKEEITLDIAARAEAKEAPESIIENLMPDMQAIDLSGCSLSQVLYYVSQGSLVFARGEQGRQLIIAGYDELNITIYDPATREFNRMGIQDGEELFAKAGNVFLSYIEK